MTAIAPVPFTDDRFLGTDEDLSKLDAIREEAPARTDRLTSEVGTFARASFDVRASTRAMRFAVTPGEDLPPRDRILLQTPAGELGINDIAHLQFAQKIGMPPTYWNRLLEHYPEGLIDHANHWLQTEPETRLVRMIRPVTEDDRARQARMGTTLGNVRAFLSDRYRTIDNYHLLNTVMETAAARGLVVQEYSLDEERLFVKLVEANYVDRSTLLRPGLHSFINQRLGFGLTIKNSEIGLAQISVEAYVLVLRCVNGLMTTEAYRVRHVGGRQKEDLSWMGDDTRKLDDAATFLKIRDRMIELTGEDAQKKVLTVMAEAAGTKIQLPEEVPLFEFVDGVGAKYELTSEERDLLKEEVVHEQATSPLGRDLTKWTISQGFTAAAKRVPTYDRKAELETAGWQVLSDPTAELLKAVSKKGRNN